MNLSDIREKVTTFLIPIFIIGVVLGGLVAIVGRTYFWDVSQLTLEIPGSTQRRVSIDIHARLIYFDADLFGFYYPVHITLPFSRTQECIGKCVFSRLPPGDATVTLFSDNLPTRTQVFIAPNTIGTLDLRPVFQLIPIIDTNIIDTFRSPSLTGEERKALQGSIEYTNGLRGLIVLRQNRENFLYDTRTKQSMALPIKNTPTYVARGQTEGEYFFWTREGVIVWNRYGKTPIQLLSEFIYRGYTFTWTDQQTRITRSDGKEIISGIWIPIFDAKEMFITDGNRVTQIQ